MQEPKPPYNLNQTLEENIQQGPPEIQGTIEIPEMKWTEWLGTPLRSPFGISASPLTMNPQWIKWASALGYDVLTFKTVRTRKWNAHPQPNWIYANESSFDKEKNQIEGSMNPYQDEDFSMGNSFGVQSGSPEVWIQEYEDSKLLLSEGQELILSVMPSIIEGVDIFDDIEQLAELANRTSAQIVEINYSCPNSKHNLTYLDIDLTTALSKRFRQKLHPSKRLLIKVSYYPNQNDVRALVLATRGTVNGITSINTMAMKVDPENNPFGENRPIAAFSGAVVRPFATEQMENLVKIRKEFGLEETLGLIAVGGVSKPEHIFSYLTIGKNIIVQSVGGVWANPNLAIDCKKLTS